MAKAEGKQLPRSPGSFEATCFSLCLVMVYPESPLTQAETASAMGTSPLPGASSAKVDKRAGFPSAQKHFAVHQIFH